MELAASNLCKTSCIMALQSQSPACPVDYNPAGSLDFQFGEAHRTGIGCFFASFSLKRSSSVASVEKHFCSLHGAGVGLA